MVEAGTKVHYYSLRYFTYPSMVVIGEVYLGQTSIFQITLLDTRKQILYSANNDIWPSDMH